MNEIKTISDVITALDAIVQECARTQSRAGYFAALYKRTTMAVSEGITKGQFEDGPRMEKLDIIFAQHYLNAYSAFRKGEECSSSWEGAFTACDNRSLIVLQHLILGIHTHINLDLAVAAAAVAPGDKIHDLEKDFNHINLIIASLIDDVQRCLEQVWFPMRLINRIAVRQQEAVLNFSIGIARRTAWSNAVLLSGMNKSEQATHIKKMDAVVRRISDRVIHPGLWKQMLLRIIRITEYEDIARTIRLIDTTVVE